MDKIDKYLDKVNEIKIHTKGFKNNPKEEILYGMNQEDFIRLVRNKLMEKWKFKTPSKSDTTYNESWKVAKKMLKEVVEVNKKYALKKIDTMLPEIINAWFDGEIY